MYIQLLLFFKDYFLPANLKTRCCWKIKYILYLNQLSTSKNCLNYPFLLSNESFFFFFFSFFPILFLFFVFIMLDVYDFSTIENLYDILYFFYGATSSFLFCYIQFHKNHKNRIQECEIRKWNLNFVFSYLFFYIIVFLSKLCHCVFQVFFTSHV